VAEHQLDDADVDAVREQPARAFVSQIVPAEIDPSELFTVPCGAFPTRGRSSRRISESISILTFQ
jgi:hypothetical protein